MPNPALTEAVYYILLSLLEPLHGYGIIQNVEQLSGGRVRLAAGTLYGAINTLLEKDWITALTGEAVLVPAFTNYPQAGVFVIAVFKIVLHPLYQIGHGSAAEQLSAHLGLAVVHIVHMAVVEAGQQELTAAVDLPQLLLGMLLQKGGGTGFVAHIGEVFINDHCRGGGRAGFIHGCDIGIFDPKRHNKHLFYIYY